jgi:hypothetical protein
MSYNHNRSPKKQTAQQFLNIDAHVSLQNNKCNNNTSKQIHNM